MVQPTVQSRSLTVDTVISQLLHGSKWAFISACKDDSLESDSDRTARLADVLDALGLDYLPVLGQWEGTLAWSYLVFGIDRSTALSLGRNYDQPCVLTDTALAWCDGRADTPITARAITNKPLGKDHSMVYAVDGLVRFVAYT